MSPARFICGIAVLLGACWGEESARIAGGSTSSIQRYPSLAQVEFYGVFTGVWVQSCAAAILTSRHVLSTAGCFDGILYAAEYRRIRAGTGVRHTGGQLSSVARAVLHPNYGQESFDSDIAVVQLLEALTYTPVVAQGIIASQGSSLPENTPVVQAGWGITQAGGLASSDLQEVTVLTANTGECRDHYLSLPTPGIVTDNMICTGLYPGSGNACTGDFGGPLYYGDVIVGLMSWGNVCNNDTHHTPTVSTAIGPFSNWIVATASS